MSSIRIRPNQFYLRADGKIVGNARNLIPVVKFDDGTIDSAGWCWLIDGGFYHQDTGEPLTKRWLPLLREITVCWQESV